MNFNARDLELFSRLKTPPEIVTAFRLDRVSDPQAREECGIKWKDGDVGGLRFRYFSPEGQHWWDRIRRDHPEMDAEGHAKNKYLGSPGKHHLYLPPNTGDALKSAQLPIVFVESEKAVLAGTAWAARLHKPFLFVGTGGVWGHRGVIGKTTDANGNRVNKKGVLPDIELFRGHPAIILFDSNVTAARPDLLAARNDFAKALKERNCTVRIIDLPASPGVNGPDDYLVVHDDQKFAAVLDPSENWPEIFETREEFENAPPLSFAIEGFLQRDAPTAIAGLSGHGKTFIAFSMTKAMLFGPGKLWGLFQVTERAERVCYYIPEASRGPVYHRIKQFGLQDEIGKRLFIRTMSKGPTIPLCDPRVLSAAKGAHNIVDTAIRFMNIQEGSDNEVAAAAALSNDFFDLLRAGASTVTALFHSPKSFREKPEMTLENMIRGSGEFGASLATAWGIKQIDGSTNTVHIENIKPRDFEPCGPFQIIGRPYIDQEGDFRIFKRPEECGSLYEEQPDKRGASDEVRKQKAANLAMLKIWLKDGDKSAPELQKLFEEEGSRLSRTRFGDTKLSSKIRAKSVESVPFYIRAVSKRFKTFCVPHT
jgi:hypothetical protein